ncbi:hypothetical protein [Chryseobacterium sp. M5A1_1a]
MITNCSSFSRYTVYNDIQPEGKYKRYNNDSLKITMLMYGGSDIAQSEKELKIIKPGYKGGNEKLFYLKNSIYREKPYEIVLSLSPKPIDFDRTYYTKTIICDNKHLVTLKIGTIDSADVKLYLENFKCIGKTQFVK